MRSFQTLFFTAVVFPLALVTVIWRLILGRSPDGLLNVSVHLVTGGLLPRTNRRRAPTPHRNR